MQIVQCHLLSAQCAFQKKHGNTQVGDNITEEVPERFSLTVVHQDKKHAFPVCPQAPLREVFHDPDDPIVVDTSSWMKWDDRWGIILDSGATKLSKLIQDKYNIQLRTSCAC